MKTFTVLITLLCVSAFSQTRTLIIQGNVTDESQKPLPYANVFIKGSIAGCITDENGNFTFKTAISANDTLVCTYIGYDKFQKPLQLTLHEKIVVNIVMKEKPIQGSSVYVTASSFTSGDEEGVTLSSLDVVKTPGAAADIMWAIKTYPGVQQAEEGAGLFVRGGDVSETVIILDGAYLYHPYRFESPNGGFFGTISPFLLKGTYFSSGGYGVEYGNSISGALVMESIDLPLKRKVHVGVGLANNAFRLDLPLVDDKLGCSISANYSNSIYLFKLNKHTLQFSNYPESFDGNINLFYKYSQTGSLKLFLFHEGDNIGVSVEKPNEIAFYEGDSENSLINASWKQVVTPNFLLNGNFAASTHLKNDDMATLNLTTKHLLFQGRLSGQYDITPTIHSMAGIEFFRNNEKITGQVPIDDLDLNPEASIYELNLHYLSSRLAAYNKWIYEFSENSNYTFGVRYEQESQSRQRFFDYRSSLSWNLISDWNIVFSVGRYHQFPEPDYYDPYVGNPNLQSSDAWHYILGFAREYKDVIYRMEFYYKDYDHLLLNDDVLNYTNEGNGYAKGIDLFIKKKWKNLNGRISASYLSSKRKWADAPYLAPTTFDITYNLTMIGEYRFTPLWYMGLKYRYATGKPYTSRPDRYLDQRVPDYHMMDISLNHIYSFFSDNMTIFYMAVSNVLGRKNIFGYRYSEDYTTRTPVTSSMLRNYYFGIQFSL